MVNFHRSLDFIYFIYFVTHIPPALLDTTSIYPETILPSFLSSINKWYIENFNDPLYTTTRIWFKSFLFCELFLQLPFFFYASISLWKGDKSIRLLLLIYASHTATTTLACISELMFGSNEGLSESQRNFLLMAYTPYLILPLIMIIDSYKQLREAERLTSKDIKLNIEEDEGKTDYYARKKLVVQAKNKYNSPKYRLVVRFTNTDIIVQIVYAKIEGDYVLAAAYSHELKKYGIKIGLTNWAAAYATGLLVARRVLTKLNLADKYQGIKEPDGKVAPVEAIDDDDSPSPFKAFLDVGLKRTSTGSKVFAVLKGASDGGIFIPHGENRFPGYDTESKSLDSSILRKYIYGGHVADYMRYLQDEDDDKYKRQFSKFIETGICADDLECIYKEAHTKIRSDPVFKPTDKKGDYKDFKKYKKFRLNLKQRRNKVQQKIEAYRAKHQGEDE
ncbi:3447_t:CDS:2 [Entrophospora sp. SA101]|nr:3447_t:CDS:2 [Entrophospora sp. SA101]